MYPQYEQDKQLVKCHPSFRQLMINQMEFYVFAHFGVNTFTDREWGDGTEDPAILTPRTWMPVSGWRRSNLPAPRQCC